MFDCVCVSLLLCVSVVVPVVGVVLVVVCLCLYIFCCGGCCLWCLFVVGFVCVWLLRPALLHLFRLMLFVSPTCLEWHGHLLLLSFAVCCLSLLAFSVVVGCTSPCPKATYLV